MSESIIKCEGLNKWYGSIQALKDVSIDIKKGEAVGLVGDNGAGKSTFIKILSGCLLYTSDAADAVIV